MKKKILPIGKSVFVKVIKADNKTQGGIIIPSTASEGKSQEGEVMAVGESDKINPNIKPGVKVLYKKYSGTEIEIDKEDYLILDGKEDILAIVE